MIVPRLPPERCGVGDYTDLLAHYLAKCGVEITFITSRHLAQGVRLRPQTAGVRVWPVIDDWGWRSLPRLAAMASRGRYDVVHIQYQNELYGRSASITALPAVLRLIAPRLPVVVTIHDYGTPWPKRMRVRALAGPYGKAWFAAMLWASACIVLTNEQDEWRFLRQRLRYPVPARRYATVPLGSNLPEIEAVGTPEQSSSLAIGYFGFVNAAKGVDTLVESFRRAHREKPDLRLIMICQLRGDDPYQVEIKKMLTDPELNDAVTVTGELDDIDAARLLASCDIVALPFRDGISLRRTTLMAALLLGRPVISTRSAVLPQALEDGRDVVLVDPANAEALAHAMLALAADPVRRAALGAQARTAARAFTWPAIAERTDALYRQVTT